MAGSLESTAGIEPQRVNSNNDCSSALLGKKQSMKCMSLLPAAHTRMLCHRSKKGGKGGDDDEDDAEDDEE